MAELPLFGDDAPAFVCAQCEDSGRLAPDPFGPGEPWFRYVAAVRAYDVALGIEPTATDDAAGMIHPVPCPFCPMGQFDARSQANGGSDATRVSR